MTAWTDILPEQCERFPVSTTCPEEEFDQACVVFVLLVVFKRLNNQITLIDAECLASATATFWLLDLEIGERVGLDQSFIDCPPTTLVESQQIAPCHQLARILYKPASDFGCMS
ncbi:MAG: hypothetical protein HEQ19_30990 [Gloeotrichia echinulata CP02]